jgi:hypothetical protein
MEQARIIAVRSWTRRDLDQLGPALSLAWPVQHTPAFADLLRAISASDAQLARERNKGRG